MRSILVLAAVIAVALSAVVLMPMKKSPSLKAKLIKQGTWRNVVDQQRALVKDTGGQPIIDNWGDYYLGNITIGTPAQPFTVLLDTGSSDTWVINVSCNTLPCKGDPDHGYPHKNRFDTTKSSTFQKDGRTFVIYYGLGKCAGNVGIDTLNLAGLTSSSQGFGVANSLDDHFRDVPYDGVLGLGWPALAQDGITPPVQTLLPQLDKPIFTIWLGRRNPEGMEGLITYGALDNVNCDAHVDYVTLSSKTYWQFPMNGDASFCSLAIYEQSGGGFGPEWTFGGVWMRTYCNIHDVGLGRIGFAKAHQS